MCSRADVATNLAGVTRLVRQAADAGAELAVLPECFALLGPEEAKVQVAEPLPAGGPILQHCRQLAATCGLELILGGFWEQGPEPGRVYNSCVHVRRDGAIGAVYRKMHLFDVDLADGTRLTESDTVAAGRAVQVTDTVVGRMGLSICYDLRFPELFRRQVEAGAKLIVVPAAFTLTTGKDHWHVLLRARAIENQCYVLAAAQWGQHAPGRVSYGHALIVDPWGIV
ncbi:MAG: carbon-nitrogen hydrolase family protein, partial [Polyangiales bacterium]